MLNMLVDTCVWLDMAKDYRHQPTIAALAQMIADREVSLILPQQSVAEFARNKDRIIRDSAKSLSSHFRRVKEAVRQFGTADGRDQVLASLDDVDHRIVILGEAVQESVGQIEKLFSTATMIEADEQVRLRATQRAIDKRAPFHRDKNSIGDAILIEIYRDALSRRRLNDDYAFVTHNKHDFSSMGVDERQPHPDFAELFADEHSTYTLAMGEVLQQYAPERMEEIKWELEYREEPRLLSEIMEAEHLLFRQVWYNRHWNRRIGIERGKTKVVTKDEWNKYPKRQHKMIVDTVWQAALAAAKRTEDEVGLENLGPWTDFEWGMVNGKLSALRWVTGTEWDFLDT